MLDYGDSLPTRMKTSTEKTMAKIGDKLDLINSVSNSILMMIMIMLIPMIDI